MSFRILHGNSSELLRGFGDNTIDSVVTDPPAAIAFMGHEWDRFRSKTEFGMFLLEVFTECLRVLKPGGHVLVWAIPKTSHWTAMAIEGAGFEIVDKVSHIFGGGFSKTGDVGKVIDKHLGKKRKVVGTKLGLPGYSIAQSKGHLYGGGFGGSGDPKRECEVTAPASDEARKWDGWSTTLKPSHEEWILAKKPVEGNVVRNLLKHGSGVINIDGCRLGKEGQTNRRYPSNTVMTHHERCVSKGCDPECPVALLNGTACYTTRGRRRAGVRSSCPGFGSSATWHGDRGSVLDYGDEGGRERYFKTFYYSAKASKKEKNEGLPPWKKNGHPTVKGLELMRYLCRMVTPKGGVVLDPFAGTGSTGVAALREGFDFVGLERDRSSVDTAVFRLYYEKFGVSLHESAAYFFVKEKVLGITSLFMARVLKCAVR